MEIVAGTVSQDELAQWIGWISSFQEHLLSSVVQRHHRTLLWGDCDSVRRYTGVIQGEWDKHGRSETRIKGEFLAPPESKGVGKKRGFRSMGCRGGRADIVWKFGGAGFLRILMWVGHWQAFLKPGVWGKRGKKNHWLIYSEGAEREEGKIAYEWVCVLKSLKAGNVEKLAQKEEGKMETKTEIMDMLGPTH